MIKIDIETSKPDDLHIIVNTEEEDKFVKDNFERIFDSFILERSPYKNTQEYLNAAYWTPSDALDNYYNWNQFMLRTKGLSWTEPNVQAFERRLNEEFELR